MTARSVEFDTAIHISDYSMVERLGDTALVGNWFVFLKAEWLVRSGFDKVLALSGVNQQAPKAAILFRGKEELTLPGARIDSKELPLPEFTILSSDKALYRASSDTVRLLIVSPRKPDATLTLSLRLNGNPYAQYSITLDKYGMCLWALQGLPEGEYEAGVGNSDICRFEIAEYRLAPLNAELTEQRFSGETLRYVLTVTAFGQPYVGAIEVELQERGKRVGQREKLTCNREGQCRGAVKLVGEGPYTLSLFAGERTATVALKGSEQARRESLVISELGEVREASLLPAPASNMCRGMYITRGGSNNAPFLVQRVVGKTVEITPRIEVEALRVVVVHPADGSCDEQLFEQLAPNQVVQLPVPAPYGIVLLGALIDGKAWEGWCAVLRPSELGLSCEAPQEARPGERITLKIKTGLGDRTIPVQVIVKDQRLISHSDPQVELAACIKKNLELWRKQASTGEIEKQLSTFGVLPQAFPGAMPRARMMSGMAMPLPPMAAMPVVPAPALEAASIASISSANAVPHGNIVFESQAASTPLTSAAPESALTRIRMKFPEVIYNRLIEVTGEEEVEIHLGDSMTRYSIEAFALLPETMDWQRVETTVDAVQSLFGELTVTPFVFPGDPVMGRLDVGVASGAAIVEVRHDDELLPLFHEDGTPITPGLPVPAGTVRFPVRPGAITAVVRDARKGGSDVSERYVTEPGKLRHIARRLRLLFPGDQVSLQDQRVVELQPLPGLERPFQVFVEGAAHYPFGCIEQTSCKLLAMFTGYLTNQEHPEKAQEYASVIPIWHKRLQSMYLPGKGFCFYPPEEGGQRKTDTHYAPQGVKHLLSLPSPDAARIEQPALQEILVDVATMVKDAASYYKLGQEAKHISDCQTAYHVLRHSTENGKRAEAASYIHSRLREHDGQMYVGVTDDQAQSQLWGIGVATRKETAYAAAALLTTRNPEDIRMAIAATNYLTAQFNEEGRLYSTVDTAACLALLMELRNTGVITSGEQGRVSLNGQEMSLAQALAFHEKVETARCIEGVIAVQITTEVIEDWSAFKTSIPVEVRLEQKGHVSKRFKLGDALDLVIRVPRYEPGLIAHICLPDALARVVGGGQVKRFSLDFCEQRELRIPLAVVGSTFLPGGQDKESLRQLLRWLGVHSREEEQAHTQHWAVIVRNMFKEEEVGNPGLLTVVVE